MWRFFLRASAALALALVSVVPAAAVDLSARVLVLDQGGQHASLLAGEPLAPVRGWALRGVPRLAPMFSGDGRYAYLVFADGWVTQLDLRQVQVSAEVQTDADIMAAALSSNGQWLAVAAGQPPRLEIYNHQLRRVQSHAVATLHSLPARRIDALVDAPLRQSFVASLVGIPELWELSYNPGAEPIHDGLVHDYRMAEAIAKPGFLGVRRTPLAVPMSVFALDAARRHVLAVAQADPLREEGGAAAALQAEVINLDIRRRITGVPLAARPQAAAPALWSAYSSSAGPRLAWLSPESLTLEVLDASTWRMVGSVQLSGHAQALQAHAATDRLWVGLARHGQGHAAPGEFDAIVLMHMDSLTEVAQLSEPGRALGPWAFVPDDARVVVPVLGQGGEALVLDPQTLQVLRRLPMDKPVAAFAVPSPHKQ